jgi:hypothetical protein
MLPGFLYKPVLCTGPGDWRFFREKIIPGSALLALASEREASGFEDKKL